MKKTKRFMAAMIAAALIPVATMQFSVSAIGETDEQIAFFRENYAKVESVRAIPYPSDGMEDLPEELTRFDEIYIGKMKNGNTEVVGLRNIQNYVRMVTTNAEETENIKASILGIMPDADIFCNTKSTEGIVWEIRSSGHSVPFIHDEADTLDSALVKKIYKALNQYSIKTFTFFADRQEGYRGHSADVLCYPADKAEALEAYFADCGKSFTIVTTENIDISYNDTVTAVPDTEMTIEEKVAFANQVYDDTGISTFFDFLESADTYGSTIDATAEQGDANCDDKVTVSDAVAVLQYIANREKYPMTAQARFNADMDGEDGLTGDDVRAIQMIDAGIWDET